MKKGFNLVWECEVIVCFVDIGGIVDHHCLNFLFFCGSGNRNNNQFKVI